MRRAEWVESEIFGETGREPTYDEVGSHVGVPARMFSRLRAALSEPIEFDETQHSPLSEIDDLDIPEIQANLKQTITSVLVSLTPREERVLRMRFGIGMDTDHTLEEVGKQFDVTRERIRQIEAKALRRLKHPSRSRLLRSFLDQ
jgi:RNA polymerase primary sigma factor